MLTVRMQVQAIADRLAGFPVQTNPRFFTQPWQSIWNTIDAAPPGLESEALFNITQTLENREEVIQTILATRPGYTPGIKSLGDIAPELPEISWAWKGFIPNGMISILAAAQGVGKSFVGLDLAHRIINLGTYPDGTPVNRPGANVIYIDAESVPQILVERASHYGLDQSKLFPMLADSGELIDLDKPKYQDRLTEMVNHLKPELIILDSISTSHSRDQNKVEEMRGFIGYLVRLAGWADCGLVMLHHIRKPSMGNRMMFVDFGIEDLSGTAYITQQARVVMGLRVVRTGQEYDPSGPRELKVLKTNLSIFPKPIGFTFEKVSAEGARLHWNTTPAKPYREPTEADQCAEWLTDLLLMHPEGLRPNEIEKKGQEAGYGRSMIHRVRKDLEPQIANTIGRKSPGNAWALRNPTLFADGGGAD